MLNCLNFPVADASARHRAGAWLMLATAAVAAAGLFAILIALARVPALGTLFPGPQFYRVALTLHVNLSQWVWFMAFAGMLWSFASRRASIAADWLAFALACGGALAMSVSPLFGPALPVMSNYMPVLGGPLFMAGLLAYGLAVLIKAVLVLYEGLPLAEPMERATRIGLAMSAVSVLAALAILAWSHLSAAGALSGDAYFETLFWGAGHVWQFSLTTLMTLCWIGLVATQPNVPPSPRCLGALYGLGAAPAVAALAIPLFVSPGERTYFVIFTELMRWTSWEIPLAVGLLVVARARRGGAALPAGVGLSLLLFVCGLLLGAAIDAQTTLVTAHYHGTVGSVTLTFMVFTYRVLPLLGFGSPRPQAVRRQLALYGWGILLMMAGLAGAGAMGAPRKLPGNLGFEFGIETVSRLLLGVGGTLATVGILMFSGLIALRLAGVRGVPSPCLP
ncbi:MAG: cbb3-type cytochrome c oxidase subunit I [Rhodocyclaceae bacterium]|nr:cbb3-type cytochrome c oxidase subunit I [Rhodocyclaceae bacterium]